MYKTTCKIRLGNKVKYPMLETLTLYPFESETKHGIGKTEY